MVDTHGNQLSVNLNRRLDRRAFGRSGAALGVAAIAFGRMHGRQFALAQEATPEGSPPAGDETRIFTLPGEQIFPEGIAYDPATGDFFVGSTETGTVYRGNVEAEAAELTVFLEPGVDGREAVTGMKVDEQRRLWICGRQTGRAFVYDAASGELIRALETPRADRTLVNDVALTSDAAYLTDSFRPILFRVSHTTDEIGEIEAWLDFAGTPVEYTADFNLNGIAATPDGRFLIVVHFGNGKLFRVDVEDKAVSEIDLGGDSLTGGDGILLDGQTLYVVRDEEGVIVPVELAADLTSGEVGRGFGDPSFDYPTTIAKYDDRLLVVNSQLDMAGGEAAPTLPFTVSSIRIP